MRSTFVFMAIVLVLLFGWYSNVAVELGLRQPGEGVPEAVLVAIAVIFLLLMRRRPALKSVAH